MKNLLKSLLVLGVIFFVGTSTSAQMKLGAGIAYDGNVIENLGITVKGHSPVTDFFEGAVSFTYFFPNGVYLNIWELNADAHYIIYSTDKYIFYPLAGFNWAQFSADYDSRPGFESKDDFTEGGLNVGAGIELIINEKISGVAEAKYINFDRFVANVGILFAL